MLFRSKLFVYCYLLLSLYSLDKRKGGKYWDKEINVFSFENAFLVSYRVYFQISEFLRKSRKFHLSTRLAFSVLLLHYFLFPFSPQPHFFLIVFSEGRRLLISKIRTVNDQFPIFDRFSTTVPILIDFPWKNSDFWNIFSKKSQKRKTK